MNASKFKSKKFVSAVILIAATVAASFGYTVSPEFREALTSAACEIVECTE